MEIGILWFWKTSKREHGITLSNIFFKNCYFSLSFWSCFSVTVLCWKSIEDITTFKTTLMFFFSLFKEYIWQKIQQAFSFFFFKLRTLFANHHIYCCFYQSRFIPLLIKYLEITLTNVECCCNIWTGATRFSLFSIDKVQISLCGLIDYDLFSTLQILSYRQHCKLVTSLLIFLWQMSRWAPLFRAKTLHNTASVFNHPHFLSKKKDLLR